MSAHRWIAWLLLLPSAAVAQEYSIGNPSQVLSAPVHLTRPAAGAVEVTNLPETQDVRLVGGKLDAPVEVTGEVAVRASAPIPVEVVNPQKASQELRLLGPVKVDDTQPVRVWIDNSWSAENPSGQEYVIFAHQGRFLPGDAPVRKSLGPRGGKVFHLTDLVVDVRPDAQVKARILTTPKSVGGIVTGVEFGEFPLAVLDNRRTSSLHFATAVPVTGDFSIEVEILSANQGGYFSAVALGYFAQKP